MPDQPTKRDPLAILKSIFIRKTKRETLAVFFTVLFAFQFTERLFIPAAF
jgi:hypothetical protein